MRRRQQILCVLTAVLVLALVRLPARAAQNKSNNPTPPELLITEVLVTFGPPDMLTIKGVNFDNGAPPVVLLGNLGPLVVSSVSPTEIVAQCPGGDCPVGDYLLSVATGPAVRTYDAYELTIGAVGPQGATGPQGAPGDAVILGFNFEDAGEWTCDPTVQPPAQASHSVLGITGVISSTGNGCDTGGQTFGSPQNGVWLNNTLNPATRFTFLTFTAAFPVQLNKIVLQAMENDPSDFSVAVEISPVNDPAPTEAAPGTDYLTLGEFNPGTFTTQTISVGLTLEPGIYHIRFRPTTPTTFTAWLAMDNVGLLGMVER